METVCVSACLVLAIVALICLFLHRRYTYWARRGVLYEKPVWLRGNLGTVGRTTSIREPFREFYTKYKGKAPFGGFYLSLRSAAVLLDLDLVKHVMIKDFANFAHRGNYYNEEDDPISAHLFNLDGPKWSEMRKKLTPTFTSLKMNLMLPTVVEIADRLLEVMEKQVATAKATGEMDAGMEVKELLARFTTDVIGNCAFGLDCNSLDDPEAQFRVIGRRTFAERRHGAFAFAFLQAFPELSRRLHIKLAQDDVSDFYMGVVKDTLEYRDKHNIKRNDFLNLLMELRTSNDDMGGLTFEQIAAQSFVFFLAGFETSSSTMGFALYELALHPEIQDRAREEVNNVLKKHGGQFNFEAMKDMKYIQQIFYETMRRYSIASILIRKAINDYQVPGSDLIIEAGTAVIIPVDAIHHDPELYPNPEQFNPEHFTPEAIEARHAMSWLPFGSGPRNCIGLRFGEMQSIVGLAKLLKHFKFSPSKETTIPLEIDVKSFVLSSKGGIKLLVQRID